MSGSYHDSNNCFPDFLSVKNDISLNASENIIDTNTNKISPSYNLPYSIKGVPNSNTLQLEDSAHCINSSGIKRCNVECISNISTTTVCDVVFPDQSPAGNWKSIESFQFGTLNENFNNFENATDIETVCSDYQTSGMMKGVDLSNKNLLQFDNYTENINKNLSSGKSKDINIPSSNFLKVEDSNRSVDYMNSRICDYPSLVDIPVPKKPLLTLPNCFDVNKACGYPLKPTELINRIDCALVEKVEMSHEFDLKNYTWNAVYIKGSAHCKFQIHVYSESENNCHLVEIHKLSGDSLTFHSIAKDIKNSISGVQQEFVESMFPISSMQTCSDLSDSDAFAAIVVFKEMAAEPFVESQLEASRILCDLSQQEGMRHILKDSGCIQILVNLATFGGTEWTRQHAVLALANLSSSQCCQEAIIDAGVLPALLTLATDGPYQSAAMRRESARLLANISDRLAVRVMAVLGRQEVSKWFSSMDTFRDGTLRVHAQRARSSLSTAIAATS